MTGRGRTKKDDGIIRINTRSKWFNISLIVLCFCFLLGVRLQINQSTGGDEPGYLLMDYSLVHDHDLNLKNNYQQESWLKFMPWLSSVPQGNPTVVNMKNAKVYSPHGVGLPLVLLPGFAIASKTGAVFTMVLLATAVVWLTWVWTNQVTKKRGLSYFAAATLAITYFFTGLVGSMYPDMLIAALTLVILIMLERYYQKTIFQVVLGIALGFLVLCHYKTLDLVVPMLGILGYKLWKSERKLPWISVGIVALFITYYFITLHQWFGVWSINTVYGSGASSFDGSPINDVSDMLFGSYRGLLIYNPILLLLFVGLPLWFKQHRETFLLALVAVGPSIVVLSLYSLWFGGDSPLGRYIIEFLPALMPTVALAIGRLTAVWQRIIIGILAVATFLITLDNTLTKFPPFDGNQDMSRSALMIQIQHHTGIAVDRLLPGYSNSTVLLSSHKFLKLTACYLVLAAVLVYGYVLSRSSVSE